MQGRIEPDEIESMRKAIAEFTKVVATHRGRGTMVWHPARGPDTPEVYTVFKWDDDAIGKEFLTLDAAIEYYNNLPFDPFR